MKRLIVGFVLALSACACQPRTEVSVPPHGIYGDTAPGYTGSGQKVAVVGDSLTVGSWDPLYRDLATDHAVRVAAYVGEAFDGGRLSDLTGDEPIEAAVDAFAADRPDVVVDALGTNTVWTGGGLHHDDLQLALTNQAAALARFSSCLVWVTLPDDPPAVGWSASWARALNDDAGRWADRTADWAAAVKANPALLGSGGVHATSEGYRVRARLIAAAVRSC